MKIIFMPILILAAILVGCSDDDSSMMDHKEENNDGLVTPKLSILLSENQNPMTGKLEIYPCQSGTGIYVGNYIAGQQTVFPSYYTLQDGEVYGNLNRPISLPVGMYTMIFWGTPKSEEPTYDSPAMTEPSLTLRTDLAQQYFGLRKIVADTTYYPVFDLVYAVKSIDVGTDKLQAALKRVVAGLKVIVKDKDNGVLSSSISGIDAHIGNISEKVNVYTAQPINPTRTVAFPLQFSADGTQMSNATVMLFPSSDKPLFTLIMRLKDGTVKKYQQTLGGALKPNAKLVLTVVLGDILSEQNTGTFTVESWTEVTETIDVPPLR